MARFEHTTAHTLDEALFLLDSSGAARPIAGGTDLLNTISQGLERPSRLVDLKPVAELRTLEESPELGLRLGALVTLSELIRAPKVVSHYDILRQAALSAASPQLRNMGTVGGNLCQRPRCWYFRGSFICLRKGGDTCYAVDGENVGMAILGGGPCHIVHPSDLAPALLALDATVVLADRARQTAIPLEEFFVGPRTSQRSENVLQAGQIIARLEVQRPAHGSRGVYLKAMERRAWSFALASVAVQVSLRRGVAHGVRIVLGGVAPVPWRARAAESQVEGRRLAPDVARQAAQQSVSEAEPMSRNAYKIPLTRALVERALLMAGQA
ncbi:MAG: xanthine dehydrogenase family protein subunit M [Chloroflexota bacterium]|nr:MAG: xanthine dehydrogenase family protein subunit M [Chloroflexota bacterium]